MGDGVRVYCGVFCGQAVENFFSAGSATALGSSRRARFQIRCSTVPRSGQQSRNWFQMAAPFSKLRRTRTACSLASAPRLAPPPLRSLAQAPRSSAAQTPVLGWQKDLRPPAPETSARTLAQGANHHRLVGASGPGAPSPSVGAARPPVAPARLDAPASAQRRVDGGFQRLVSHPRRPTGRSLDRARSLQPLYPGHPFAAPSP